MGFSTKACLFSAALLATSVQGHMKMKTPTPYGESSLNNSPLDGTGSDFPCKQRAGVYAMPPSGSNTMAHGEQQTLSFTGSAVHGGGSCQIALSKDTQPTKDSKWMVIKSIIGGCPANVPGNLPEDPNGNGASSFQFTIPDGIEPGDYALSWTWFNKVGNRELYQNCAPVKVTGAKKRRYAPAPKQSKRDTSSFPDIFIANIGNGITTPEGQEIIFPNPGADVQTAGNGPFTQMPGGNGGSGGSPPQQTQTAATATETATTPTTTAYGGGNGGNGGNNPNGGNGGNGGYGGNGGSNGGSNGGYTASPAGFAEGASSISSASAGGIVTPLASDGTPESTATASVTVPTSTPDTGKNTSDITGSSSSGGCTEGNWKCIDGSSFQRCASGQWSATISMASGMKCEIGESANIAMSKVAKRSHNHGHGRFHIFSS